MTASCLDFDHPTLPHLLPGSSGFSCSGFQMDFFTDGPLMLPAGSPAEQAGHHGIPLRHARAAGAVLLHRKAWPCAISVRSTTNCSSV